MLSVNMETKIDCNDIWQNPNPLHHHDSELFTDLIDLSDQNLAANIIQLESELIPYGNHLDTTDPSVSGKLDYKTKLQESEIQIKNLLKEASSICEKQKIQLLETTESFQSKLQNHIVGRHSIMDFKKKETADQEEMICKLQLTLSELQNAACCQEVVLLKSKTKLETLMQELHDSNSTVNQMRELLLREEEWLGKNLIDKDLSRYKDNGLLIRIMENCLKEYHDLLSSSNTKLKKSESDFENIKMALHEQKQILLSEHQDKLNKTLHDHEKELSLAKEKVSNSRSQTLSLQQQLTSIENNHQKQLENYNNQVKELEMKLRHKKESCEQEGKIWQEKIQSLYRKVEDLQLQLSSHQNDNKEIKNYKVELETQNENLQKTISKLNADLSFERKQYKQLLEKEQEHDTKLNSLEKCLDSKEMEIKHLEKAIYVVKEENKAKMENLAKNIEHQIQLKTNAKVEKLVKELQTSNEKCSQTSQEIVKKQNEINNVQKELVDVKRKVSEMKIHLDSISHQYDQSQTQIEKKSEEFRLLAIEHDHIQHLNQQGGQEVMRLQEQLNHISAQLAEKTTEASLFRQRSEQLKQQFERKSEEYTALAEHKINLMKSFNEKVREIEKLNHSLDAIYRKLRLKEKRLVDLEEELDKVVALYNSSEKELREIRCEKESADQQQSDTNSQLNQLKEERDALILMVTSEKDEKIREINKLEAKLKIQEQDLKITKQHMTASDDRASCIVFTLQKQMNERGMHLENLSGKVKSLEDALDIMKQEKEAIKEEREKLAAMLNKTLINNDKLTGEVNALSRADREKKALIMKMENALGKAARKYASVQSLLEHHEQDINKIKMKYQHNLKELQVSGNHLIGHHQFVAAKSSPGQLLSGPECTPQGIQQKRPGLIDTRMNVAKREQYRPTQSMSAMSDVWIDLKKILTEIQNMTTEVTIPKEKDIAEERHLQLQRTNNYIPRRSPSDGTVDSSMTNNSKNTDGSYSRNRKTSDSDLYSLHGPSRQSECHSVVSIETLTSNNKFDDREIGQEHFCSLHDN